MLPAPADGEVAAALDATAGLEQASAEDRSTRAWQVDRPLSAGDLDGSRSWLRVGLLLLQGLAILVVLVLCAPSTDRDREGGGDEAPVRGRRRSWRSCCRWSPCWRCCSCTLTVASRTGRPPVETPLTSASVVCPSALPGTGSDLLGVSILGADPEAKVTGDVQVGLGSSVGHRCQCAPAASRPHRRGPARRWSPAPTTSRPVWSPGARSRPRWPRSTARHRWPTSGSPGSARTPPTTR